MTLVLPLLALLAVEPEVQSLLDRAAALPPELNADLILRVLDSGKVPESEKELALLEDAYRLSQQARLPTPVRHAASVVLLTDSTAGMLSAVTDLKLDRLSLAERALNRMLAVHPRLARDRFLVLTLPHPPAPDCREPLVPRFEPYFRLLFAVLENGFSPEERRSGKALGFVSGQLRSLSSPEQIEAAATALADAPLTALDRAELSAALVSSLSRCQTTWRSFGRLASLLMAVDQVTLRLVDAGQPADNIGRALSAYIQRHMSLSRCAEAATESGSAELRRGVGDFNDYYVAKLKIEGLAAIKLNDSTPPQQEGASSDYPFWSAPASKQLLSRYQGLRSVTEEQRRTTEWEAAMRAFLNDLDRFQPKPPQTPAAWFHERMILAIGLLEVIPSGPMRDEQWEVTLRFLRDSPMLFESPAEWLRLVRDVFKQPDAATYVPRMADARLALLFEADTLLGPRK